MRAAAVVALTALAVAGCGGSGRSSQRLSQDEFVQKADAICAQVATQVKALPTPTSIDAIPAFVDKTLAITDDATAKIRNLEPPAAMEQGVQNWLDKTKAERDELTKLRSAAAHGDVTTVREISAKGTQIDTEGNTLARTLGLTTCANT